MSWINARDFGAVGDGVHDDTAAVQAAGVTDDARATQAAIDAAEAFPGRMRAGDGPWIPCGAFNIDIDRADAVPRVMLPEDPHQRLFPFEFQAVQVTVEYRFTPVQLDGMDYVVATPELDLESPRDWPAGGSTCAHVCGPDPGHVCDARAVTHLTHPLPSGGTRTLPLCGPCADAEQATAGVAS